MIDSLSNSIKEYNAIGSSNDDMMIDDFRLYIPAPIYIRLSLYIYHVGNCPIQYINPKQLHSPYIRFISKTMY